MAKWNSLEVNGYFMLLLLFYAWKKNTIVAKKASKSYPFLHIIIEHTHSFARQNNELAICLKKRERSIQIISLCWKKSSNKAQQILLQQSRKNKSVCLISNICKIYDIVNRRKRKQTNKLCHSICTSNESRN